MITHLHVRAINPCSSRGFLSVGANQFPCRLGKSGRRNMKREGDGASPVGSFKLEQLYFRPDKMHHPRTLLKIKSLKRSNGWCDSTQSFAYNRLVKLPFELAHEKLWRADSAYDIVITTSHNQRPRVRGAGSAIFLHLTNHANGTEGCVALSMRDLRIVLSRCSRNTRLVI